MNRTASLFLFIAACAAFTIALVAASAAPVSAQTYPVLVYDVSGGRGTYDHPVAVNVVGAASADSLCATFHQAGYHIGQYVWDDFSRRDDGASLSLNGGAFVGNWNTTATVDAPADSYLGFGGAFATVRGCWAISDLGSVSEGANTITFRWDVQADQTQARSGYRVLEIDVQDAAGNDLLTGETYDDPEQWTITGTVGAAYDNASAISAGQALWTARNSLVDTDGATALVASCRDCHATTGFDLRYFNYEPDVIVTRARHHGLTDDEARKIAAYIL